MVTPFIVGQVALLRGVSANFSLNQVGILIGGTARPLDDVNRDHVGRLGAGRTDMLSSLELLKAGQ